MEEKLETDKIEAKIPVEASGISDTIDAGLSSTSRVRLSASYAWLVTKGWFLWQVIFRIVLP